LLTGDYNDWFTHSYAALFAARQISDSEGYNEDGNRPVRGFGSAASPLMGKIDGSHYDARLSPTEQRLVQLWIDTGATYPGTYAALRPGTPPSGHTRVDPGAPYRHTHGTVNTSSAPNGGESVAAILKRRCLTCHSEQMPMGSRILKKQRHRFLNVPPDYCLNLYNLSHPDKSVVLRAPLAKKAGGYGWCRDKQNGKPAQPTTVFADRDDPDYQTILQAIEKAKVELNQVKRFDMADFRPTRHYVREMKRYGVLPPDLDPAKDPIDVYETDRAYWRSLWYSPPGAGAPKLSSN
jgi:hypothetical protein